MNECGQHFALKCLKPVDYMYGHFITLKVEWGRNVWTLQSAQASTQKIVALIFLLLMLLQCLMFLSTIRRIWVRTGPWLDETRHVCTARRFFICLWKIFSVYNKSDILTTLFVLTEETWKFIKHVLINTWWFFYSSPPLSRHNKTNCKSHSDCCSLIVVNSYWLRFKSY